MPFIRVKSLKVLINGFRDLPTVSKFHFVEKRIVHKKIHDAWDRCAQVLFQEKDWYDEPIILDWISQQWNNCFINPPTNGYSGKTLIADVYCTQQTEIVNYSEEDRLHQHIAWMCGAVV